MPKGDDQFPEGLAPVIVRGSGSHVFDRDGNEFIERTVKAVGAALDVYARAIDDGVEKYLYGRAVAPVFRKYNTVSRPTKATKREVA